MDYVFTVRSIKDGKFANEPGASYFLEVPSRAKDTHPKHRVEKKADWVAKVIEEAKTGEKNPDTGAELGDILVYVHGFNTPTRTMLERLRLLKKGLAKQGFKGGVISFDWPSANSALNYLEDRSDAKQTARRLVDEGISTFAALQTPDCEINVHILAHSMGAFVVREAFDDADDRPKIASVSWSVSQVLFIGADVSAGSMAEGNSKSSSLYRHTVRLTNYYNPFDGVLSLSNVKRIGVAPRVGRVGLPDDRPGKAVNVNTGAYFSANRDKFEDLNFAGHIWYFYDETFMRDAYHTIKGQIDRNAIPTRAGFSDELELQLIENNV